MSTPKIEAPEREVLEVSGTITFVGGGTATFTCTPEGSHGEGEQPWLGKSVDVRDIITQGLEDEQLWDDGMIRCPNCDERKEPGEMNYTGLPYEMCDSCIHNAKRSGWEPPSEERADIQLEAIKVLAKYELESDPNGYDGTPDNVVDEMAAVLKKVAEADA